MQHGIICPVSQLERFATQSKFHLILPHLIEQYPAYKEFYTYRAKEGDHVLIDNSIFELEKSFDYRKMIEYAEEIGAVEISAPEVLKDRDASRELRDEFLEYYVKSGSKVNILAVAQGRSIQEVENSYFELLGISEIKALGLPFDLDDNTGEYASTEGIESLTLRRVLNRYSLICGIDVIAILDKLELKPTHLMGLSDAVELQLYKHGEYNWIRSNDSSTAFVHGVNGVRYTERGLPCEKIKQKLDFGGYKELTPGQIEDINYNISTILGWLK